MNIPRSRFPWLYLLLAYALAWIFWIPLALTGRDYQSSPWLIFLLLLGVFGPGLAGIILTFREGTEGRREFWVRVFDFRRIRPMWYALIILFWPGLCLIALAIHSLSGGSLPNFELLDRLISQPAGLLVIPVLYVIQAGLEELGWRGYMLDRLQAIWNPLGAALILGVFHALWHLPLFWIAGTNQITFGFGLDFWIFIGMVLAGSVYSTGCYNGNQRSTLAVILLHFTSNLSLDLFTGPGAERRLYFLLVMAGALMIAVIWGLRMRSLPQRIGKEIRDVNQISRPSL
jgi:membrane protease YdiL (CAAX protease family)